VDDASAAACGVITIAERYTIERELGRGGMAVVMLARDVVHERLVAIKLFRAEFAGAVSHDRFLREMRFTARLQHPHIVPLYDSGIVEDVPYYVMPFVDGESLRARLERERQLPVADAVRIATDVAGALAYAHAHGIVHRDIKPENILLAGDQALVADFGIARAVVEAASDRLTSTGLAVGTPAYMSPEQATGDRAVDARSDIYSLGSVLFEMLAGVPPFVGPTPQAVIARRLAAAAPPIRELRATVPHDLAAVVAHTLERVPADRFQTAAELSAALSGRGPPAVRRRLWSRWALIPVAVVVAAAAMWLRPGARDAVGARPPAAPPGPAADPAIGTARAALAQLDLDAARRALEPFVAAHPEDPAGDLWLAQAGSLIGDSAIAWSRAARIASTLGGRLAPADSLRAAALFAIVDHRREDACAGFRRLVDVVPSDPTAALSLADCVARDDVVVRDARSPSGWRFRSSPFAAVRLYQRIVQEYPTLRHARARVYQRLADLLITEPYQFRPGRDAASDTLVFDAFPDLRDDTLAFVPYPLARLAAGGDALNPPRVLPALVYSRMLLRTMALDWARTFPTDADAHAMLATALEATGELTPARPGAPSALAEAEAARRGPGAPLESRIGVTHAEIEVRLLFKLGDYAAARALADSVLGAQREPRADAIDELASIAALIGRARAALDVQLIGAGDYDVLLPDGRARHIEPALSGPAIALFTYAALGAPADTIRSLDAQVESLLPIYTTSGERAIVRDALLGRALSLAVPVTGPDLVGRVQARGNYLIDLEQKLARGDRVGVRVGLDAVARDRARQLPTATTPDAAYEEAWLRAAIGDTAASIRQLDANLQALPTVTARISTDLGLAAALPRLMVLRAELGARRQDGTGARWAAAVCTLWQDADALLAPTRDRMCALAARPSR